MEKFYMVGIDFKGEIIVVECDGVHSTTTVSLLGVYDDRESAERYAATMRWQQACINS
jgi:hypothetical protein